jgi:hypothetical protein
MQIKGCDLYFVFVVDKVYPLPENWPKIPQIFRRKSCELTKATSPCVKKAVSHLELIQNIIEEWFKEREEEMKSRPCSVKPGIILCHMTIIQHNTDKISVEIN